MTSRPAKFLSFYKPYLGLLAFDLFCAFIVSAITLILPLCIRYITQNLLGSDLPNQTRDLAIMAGIMLALVALHTLCNLFVDYRGHMMGAMMERDMRRELFAHFQKLSFGFYDDQKTGSLMSALPTISSRSRSFFITDRKTCSSAWSNSAASS